jgi:hypothetical protein
MNIDETDFQEDNYEKNMKYDIIKICGIKYKVIHLNSSSKNNKILICLGQIKYFIKKILKIFLNCLRYLIDKFLIKVINYVYNTYGDDFTAGIFTFASVYILTFGFFTCLEITIKHLKGFTSELYTTMIYKLISLIMILIQKGVILVVQGIFILISILLVLATLSITFNIIKRFIKYAYNLIYNLFNVFYKQIPEIEELEIIQIV